MARDVGPRRRESVAQVDLEGALAAVDAAMTEFGTLGLAAALEPSIAAARDGFPLSQACHYYLRYSGRSVFGRDPVSFAALHPDGERLLPAGGAVVVELENASPVPVAVALAVRPWSQGALHLGYRVLEGGGDVDEAVRNDPGIYPSDEVKGRLFALATRSDKEIRNLNRLWTRIKAQR